MDNAVSTKYPWRIVLLGAGCLTTMTVIDAGAAQAQMLQGIVAGGSPASPPPPPPPPAARQALVPGLGYVNETTTTQQLIPGVGYINEGGS